MSIGQIALTIQKLPRAVAFYRDTLGLKLLFEVSGMAFFITYPSYVRTNIAKNIGAGLHFTRNSPGGIPAIIS